MRETMNVQESRTAENLFYLRASVQVAEHSRELELAVRSWGEVGVTTLRGDRPQAPIETVQVRLSESGAGGYHGGIAARVRITGLQNDKFAAFEQGDACGHRLEIVQQRDAASLQITSDLRGADIP